MGTREDDPFPTDLYESLRGIAQRHMKRGARSHSLQPTALVHEAYLKLATSSSNETPHRTHFLALASRVMRQVLVDHARRRDAVRRGAGHERTTLSGVEVGESDDVEVLELHAVLEELSRLNPTMARLVELRFFGGLTEEEAAAELGLSRATLTRQWRFARAWLARKLSPDAEGSR